MSVLTIASFILGLSGIIFAVRERLHTKKIMNSIENMLQQAINGTFTENDFDETLLSKIETKFVQYLCSSQISANTVMKERDKIKTLISDISHQTKTPIANILLYSELLEESNLSDEQQSNACAIHEQSEKLCFLIDSLVKLSRMENGILTLTPKKQSVNEMLNEICRHSESKAAQKGLIINLKSSDAQAFFDKKWTTEALTNIIDNAIKYTNRGEITVSCRIYELFLCIDIKDTGIGISEDDLPKIFGRFYRSTDVSDNEGVGIGLHLAREIVNAEQGYITVSSEKGKGSVFSVFLPV